MGRKREVFYLFVILVILFTQGAAKAEYYIHGIVLNASDGYSPDGMDIRIYKENPTLNLTAAIGSDRPNNYTIECSQPPLNCSLGDTIFIDLVLNGSGYEADSVNVSVGSTVSTAPNMTLAKNIAPSVVINSPANASTIKGTSKINATVKNNSLFKISEVVHCIGNFTGNYSKDGIEGYSALEEQEGYYTSSFNSSKFAFGNYTIYVIANTTHGSKNITKAYVTIDNRFIDIYLTDENITFSDDSPPENDTVTVYVNVSNIGNKDAKNVKVEFFKGNYSDSALLDTAMINISAGDYRTLNTSFNTEIGINKVYIIADPDHNITESDEDNNLAVNNVTVSAWQYIIGNVSGSLVLGDSSGYDMISWKIKNVEGSNIFVVDSDSSINFDYLEAFSRTTSKDYDPEDFNDADALLNMSGLPDSINKTFLDGQDPKGTAQFTIFGKTISDVPVINSTENYPFITGILWDTSEDTDSSFDAAEKENIIFVTQAKEPTQGAYGTYSFEIKIPAMLRSYKGSDSRSVSIYTELR